MKKHQDSNGKFLAVFFEKIYLYSDCFLAMKQRSRHETCSGFHGSCQKLVDI